MSKNNLVKKAKIIGAVGILLLQTAGFSATSTRGDLPSSYASESYSALVTKAADGEIRAVKFIEHNQRFYQDKKTPLTGLVVFREALFKVIGAESSVNSVGVTVIRYELEHARGKRLKMDVYSLHNRAGKNFYRGEPNLNWVEKLLLKGLVSAIVS